ncbi:MAG: nitroreductase family protein [Planctomycetota bacterium]|jgi:nitroreductase
MEKKPAMEMIELLRHRRSVRKFTDQAIEPDKVELLKEALLRSPTSRNINPWEFIFVDDRDLLRQLAVSKPHGASFLQDAALGIVVCADGQKSDVWTEDCSIASILVQMVAQSVGLGTCWIQIRNRMFDDTKTSQEHVRSLLKMPDRVEVESIIALGYPAEKKKPIPHDDLDYTKIRINGYGPAD